MTEFERRSVEIAADSLAVSQWSAIIAASALLASIVAGILAFITVRTIIGQLESAKWNALLSFEQDMSLRRERFQEIARELPESGTVSPTIKARLKEAQENYLNAVERLSSSILNGQFPELEMKQSYREFIALTIRDFPDAFKAGTALRKTLKLHERWQD
ncbi:MAG TPA: hypothetical protein VJ756_13595 [Terriglobales bacterium]|nr:hypothetical protein [Terriglobales bacterium]